MAQREKVIPSAKATTTVTYRVMVLDVSEIDWIAASDYDAELYALGRRYLLRESLNSLAARLEIWEFVRVHRSAIVNVARVRELRRMGDTAVAVLRDGTAVPVSRRRREALAAALRRGEVLVHSSQLSK